ncbi:hypothetical protein AWC38_SpisGene22795, partial [Stylophora pistillata]
MQIVKVLDVIQDAQAPCLQVALFCIFLLLMSYSQLHASTKLDPTQYNSALDSLRGFCEVFTLLMVVFYICEEIKQIRIWLSVLLMMAYMGTVTVILLNILIAQMSTTYTQAKKFSRLEYDVDRILQLTRMERFPFLNLRVKYYKEGDWISEMNLAKELLEFSEDRNPWESVEEKLSAIREKMRKMISHLLEIVLDSELNTKSRYQTFSDETDKSQKTLLHYAAELGFFNVTKTLVKNCPLLLTLKTKQSKRKRALLPVELALIAENDDVAAYLIRSMWHE